MFFLEPVLIALTVLSVSINLKLKQNLSDANIFDPKSTLNYNA